MREQELLTAERQKEFIMRTILETLTAEQVKALPFNLIHDDITYVDPDEPRFKSWSAFGKQLGWNLLHNTVDYAYQTALLNLNHKGLVAFIMAILPKWAYFKFLEEVGKHIPETNAERYGSVKRERTAA